MLQFELHLAGRAERVFEVLPNHVKAESSRKRGLGISSVDAPQAATEQISRRVCTRFGEVV